MTRAQALAMERIRQLFSEAENAFATHPERADRYVHLARKLGMRYTVRIPKDYRLNYCRQCERYLKLGVNARVRTRSGRTVFTCLGCGWIRRYPYRATEKKTIG